jgi:hypothetical protein
LPAALRSTLSAISLLAGLVTTATAAVTFLAEHSWDEFLFRAGVITLVALVIAGAVVATQEAGTGGEGRPEVVAKPANTSIGLGGTVEVALIMTAFYAGVGVLLFLLGIVGITEMGAADFVRWVGAVAILNIPMSLVVGWSDWAPALISRSSTRPCPRCGHDVPTGQMKCQSCGFDFWTVGAGNKA